MDTIELTQEALDRSPVDPVKRAATNRAMMMFHRSNPFDSRPEDRHIIVGYATGLSQPFGSLRRAGSVNPKL